ncbi:MAG TPA: hypothetical protein VFU07_02765 [Candidatus Lumbricidophila sp.]|nr:hypothetical protein [Candidatus Lumbricidophila sp.]
MRVPWRLWIVLAVIFSAYHVVLGVYAIGIPATPVPALIGMGLYAMATFVALFVGPLNRMPTWLAHLLLGLVLLIIVIVPVGIDLSKPTGYATWYVAAVGTLLAIMMARRARIHAWIGVAALIAHTVVWAGPGALGGFGVIGSAVWVGIAQVLIDAIANTTAEARRYIAAEQEAEAWRAAQDANVFEGLERLRITRAIAAPMLRSIVDADGALAAAERAEARLLEASVRDEIRGRMLLDDRVRAAVRAIRGNGGKVLLLDEGGLDQVGPERRQQIISGVADALEATQADEVIVRTATPDSAVAVTVVGLVHSPESSDDDGEVETWLAIPREAATER